MNIEDVLNNFHPQSSIFPEALARRPVAGGYWFKRNHPLVDVSGDNHIDYVIDNPKLFNMTLDEIKQIFNDNGETFQNGSALEGKARAEIIKQVTNDGWIRIRHYTKPEYWSIQCDNFSLRKSDIQMFVDDAVMNSAMYPDEELHILGFNDDDKHIYTWKDGGATTFINESKIKESSFSSIIKHIENGSMFSVISACRGRNRVNGWNLENGDISKDEALKLDSDAQKKLKLYLKEHQYGFIEQASVYDGMPEFSLFIPYMPKDEAIELGVVYKQKAIIYKDSKEFGIYYTLDFVDDDNTQHQIGEAGMKFKQNVAKNTMGNSVITFNPEVLKYANSQLMHGSKSQKKQPFAFIAEDVKWYEYHVLERWTGLKAYTEGRKTEYWVEIKLN